MPVKTSPAANAPGSEEDPTAAGAAAGTEDDAFTAAFDEYAGVKPAAGEGEAPADRDGAAGADPQPATSAAAQDAGEGGDDAVADADPAPAAAPAAAATDADRDRERDAETWNKLDDAGRFSAYRAAKGRARAEVSTLARRNAELERELANVRRQQPVAPNAPVPSAAAPAAGEGAQPTAAEIAAASASPEAWQQFEKDYPEVARAMDARLEARLDARLNAALRDRDQRLDSMDARLAPVAERAERDATATELEVLSGVHEDWRGVVEDQAYWNWLAAQSAATQQLANSPYGSDVASAITLYKAAHPELAAAPAPADQQPESEVQRLQREREERLKGATTVQTRPRGGTRPTDSADFSGAFNAYAAAEERQMNAR